MANDELPEALFAPTPVLWSVADIAAYYRRSERHVRRLVKTPGFPPPTRGDARRWVPAHVREWTEGTWTPEPGELDPGVLRPSRTSGNRVVRRQVA
jgi:hypothetical protein